MTGTLASSSFSGQIPLFPLPNVVLFPGVGLPLHIFEPRYKAMMDHALGGDRLIGSVLLREGWEQEYHEMPPIYEVGCVGEIVREEQLPDGRWNLVLQGLRRFRIHGELDSGTPFRVARVALIDEPRAGDESQDKLFARTSQLLLAVNRFLGETEESGRVVGQLFSGEVPLSSLADRMAAVLALPLIVKQRVLETGSAAGRADLILQALEEAAEEERQGEETEREDTPPDRLPPGGVN